MSLPFAGFGAVRAMRLSDYQATIFPGTQSGIQDALDYCSSPGGEVRLGPGTFPITGLTMYGKTTLTGSGQQNTILSHSGASTAIREKTAGEGNGSQGAAGIIIRDISVRASGSTGDGINLGNQGGPAFNSGAMLRNLLVRDFASGTGIKLNAGATHACQECWSVRNSVGYYLDGGSSFYSGIWAEGNTDTGLRVVSPGNSFVHVHLEDLAAGPSSLMEMGASGDYNSFIGITIQLGANGIAKLIRELSGANYNQYIGVLVISAGHTWTHTIYNEGNTQGVGTGPTYIPAAFGGSLSNTVFSYFRDTDSGIYMPIRGGSGIQNTNANSMASASTITPDGFSSFFVVSGSNSIDNIGTNPAWVGRELTIQTVAAPTFKHASGGTGNIRCVGSADVVMTANDVIKFMYTGTVWVQTAPVVAI